MARGSHLALVPKLYSLGNLTAGLVAFVGDERLA